VRHDVEVGAWNRANLAFAGWCLFTIAALLGFHRWRTIRQQRRSRGESDEPALQRKQAFDQKKSATDQAPSDDRWPPSPSPPTVSSVETKPAEGGLDLQLLRFLSDGTAKGLGSQIELYLEALDSDRRAAHTIFAEGDPKKIHRIAHRLVAHAGTVQFMPLYALASAIQSEAAILTRKQLEQRLRDLDREFANLRNILNGFRASTEGA
jgi:hypothetical protein